MLFNIFRIKSHSDWADEMDKTQEVVVFTMIYLKKKVGGSQVIRNIYFYLFKYQLK